MRLTRCTFSALVLVPTLLLCVSGCHVASHKDGKNDNVDIGTPFGSMQVKTNDNVAANSVGITPYPGAMFQKKDKDGDSDAADVNMNFGSFHFGVKALSYLSNDTPDKVLAFYKKDLGRYGAVLQCKGAAPVGQPARTAEGLTCSDESNGVHIHAGDTDMHSHAETELRAGSKQHMHIVAIEPQDAGTKIGLVALDLPGSLGLNGDEKKSN